MAVTPVSVETARSAAARYLDVLPSQLVAFQGAGGWQFTRSDQAGTLGGGRVYVDTAGRGYDMPSFVSDVGMLERLLESNARFADGTKQFTVGGDGGA